MSTPVRFWRYSLPSENHEGWAVIFIDSCGVFSAVSDHGNWGYAWTHHGCRDPREFIAGLDVESDYAARKFGGAPSDYQGRETLRSIKREILDARRNGQMDRDTARAEWRLLRVHDVSQGTEEFCEWMRETSIGDPAESARYDHPSDLKEFCSKTLPRLAVLLRAELTAEGYFQKDPA